MLSADNHNSVNGIREYRARARGADVRYARLDDELRLDGRRSARSRARTAPSLFAFPAQSNFSGVQHPLALSRRRSARGYHVLLDAAAFVPDERAPPGRVPAGLRRAVVLQDVRLSDRRRRADRAARRAGARSRARGSRAGRWSSCRSQHRTHLLKAGAEAFEDGTPNFAAIAAVPAGLELLGEVGMDNVKRRVVSSRRRC